MKWIKYLFLGLLFGIVMSKSEAISWYRIYEMFHFDAFHMFGIIGSAVLVGSLGIAVLRQQKVKNSKGYFIEIIPKQRGWVRYLVGGIIFGLGWALVGACPGPMFVLLGHGFWSLLIVIFGAFIGTFIYGLLRHRLPH